MGLDCSHGAFSGAYSAFSRWRNAVAEAAGYSLDTSENGRTYPKLDWDSLPDATLEGTWKETPEDPLLVLLAHSDCDGDIFPAQAGPLANRLEELLPEIAKKHAADWGHITRDGGMVAVTRRFIYGLRLAQFLSEPLRFG
jgi:hypothetical protein